MSSAAGVDTAAVAVAVAVAKAAAGTVCANGNMLFHRKRIASPRMARIVVTWPSR